MIINETPREILDKAIKELKTLCGLQVNRISASQRHRNLFHAEEVGNMVGQSKAYAKAIDLLIRHKSKLPKE